MSLIIRHCHGGVLSLALNDPARRNALSLGMFDALHAAVTDAAADASVRVVFLRGEGKAFCAGFDLGACVDDPSMMATLIHHLSQLDRSLRRLPQPVVAAVHGAAIAGGCAILSACDFVFVERAAKLGYPVHRIGVSPAVTLPTLMPAVGPGPARALVMSGELIDGMEAKRIGLATHVIEGEDRLLAEARSLCAGLAAKPPGAVRATKAWLNELDGSLGDGAFDETATASASLADGAEAIAMLAAVWGRSG